MRRRWLWALGGLLALAAIGYAGLIAWLSHLERQDLPLPPGMVALADPAGQALLASAAKADHDALIAAFQPQEKRAWCGVASATTVLSALRGATVAQPAFFTDATDEVRTWWQVTTSGMPLGDLAGLLRAHGVPATAHHADEGLAAFRAALRRNMAASGDYLIVNWRRDEIGQVGAYGHLSPVSAYDEASDAALILDVGAHVYPKAWAPVERLFAAMDTVDGDGGKKRGWVEVGP